MTDMITITGNLAADPDRRVIPGGVTVVNFRVGSTSRRYDKPTEQWVDTFTNWYQVSAYRSLGEHAATSLHKGDRVIVQGRLRLREWDNGTKRGLAVEIDAESLGHDLQWGTTTFHRSRGAAPAPAEPSGYEQSQTATGAPALASVPPVTSADGWTIPAASAADAELVEAPF